MKGSSDSLVVTASSCVVSHVYGSNSTSPSPTIYLSQKMEDSES